MKTIDTFLSMSGNSPPEYSGLVKRKKRQPSIGGPRNTFPDSRPAQKPPSSLPAAGDRTILVHECFDPRTESTPAEDCPCSIRVPPSIAAARVRDGDAQRVFAKNGKHSIVLCRPFIEKHRRVVDIAAGKRPVHLSNDNLFQAPTKPVAETEYEIDPKTEKKITYAPVPTLPILKFAMKAGETEEQALEFARKQLGIRPKPRFIVGGLDSEIDKFVGKETQRKAAKHKSAAGFVKGSGGMRVAGRNTPATAFDLRTKEGKLRERGGEKAKSTYSAGHSRDSDERWDEQHDATGQMNSQQDVIKIVPESSTKATGQCLPEKHVALTLGLKQDAKPIVCPDCKRDIYAAGKFTREDGGDRGSDDKRTARANSKASRQRAVTLQRASTPAWYSTFLGPKKR